MSAKTDPKRGQSSGLVIALVASFLVLLSPAQPALALPADLESGNYANDGSCDLGITGSADPSVSAFPISTPGQLWELADCSVTNPGHYYQLTQDIDATSISWSESIGFSSSSTFPFVGNLDGNNFKIDFAISTSRTDSTRVGLFAITSESTITDLLLSGSVMSATDIVGGFVGYAYSSSFASISGELTASGVDAIGGLIGVSVENLHLSDVQLTTSIHSAGDYLGGLVGGFEGNFLTASGIVLNSSIVSGETYIGGLFGATWAYTNLQMSGVQVDVSVSGTFRVGGLVGEIADGPAEISNILVKGNIQSQGLDNGSGWSSSTGGVLGYLGYPGGEITNTLVLAHISVSDGLVGGILGDTGGPVTASATISNTLFAGTIFAPTRSSAGSIYGGNGLLTGDLGMTFASSSYWLSSQNSDLVAAPTFSNFSSVLTRFLDTESRKVSTSYVGWDFTTVWGFDCITDYPQLQYFNPSASVSSCASSGGGGGSGGGSVPSGLAIPGPVILSYTPSVVDTAGSQNVTFTGLRLLRVTSVSISGLVAPILSQIDTSLLVDIPALVAGSYSVDFTYDQGSVVRLNFLVVEGASPQAALGKVNVGSFNGKLVVYAANLEGSRISWKVGGRWGRAVASTDFARFDRPTPRRGVQVTVQIFVDGELKLTKVVRTR